jgi:acyl-CoA synthetase (AMP-forming)/AMP-acid ligase II
MAITRKTSANFARIFDIITYQQEKYPNRRALNKFTSSEWKGYSIDELQRKAEAQACWFIGNNFPKR